MASFFSIFLTLLGAGAAQAQIYKTDCGQTWGYSWCVSQPPGASPQKILYYLHGNGGSEHTWETADHQHLEQAWLQTSKPPAIITVSFGPTWFLTERSGLLAKYLQAVIPQIERKYGFQPTERILMGESMGGFNSLQIYFHSPQSFQRYVIACPAVLDFAPDASDEEVTAYLQRHQPYVVPKLVTKWKAKMLAAYATPAEWRANDPIRLSQTQGGPPVFMTADAQDAFGFQEGTAKVASGLRSRGVRLNSVLINPGGHCDQSPESLRTLADFVLGR